MLEELAHGEKQTAISLFKIILDSITEGVFTINKDRVITSFNQAAETITGFSREEAIGKPRR